ASANDTSTCAPPTGFMPQFCLNLPLDASLRRETTVQLATVLNPNADVRINEGVPASDVLDVASALTLTTTIVPAIPTIDAASSDEPSPAAPPATLRQEPVNVDPSALRA